MVGPEPRLVVGYDCLKIYFGDLLHPAVRRSDLVALDSWKWGAGEFWLQFTFRNGGVVRTSYAELDVFVKILKLLDGVDLFTNNG